MTNGNQNYRFKMFKKIILFFGLFMTLLVTVGGIYGIMENNKGIFELWKATKN